MLVADYAGKHAVALPDGLKLPIEALAGKDFYMVGEMHCVAANDRLKLDLVRQLSAQANLRHLVLEINILHAALLDYCVYTGDSVFLDRLLSIMLDGYDSADSKRFWYELLALNASLPPDRRVRIHGFELSAFFLFYPVLSELLVSVPADAGYAWLSSDLTTAAGANPDKYEMYKALLVFGQACIGDDGSMAALFGPAGSFIIPAGALDARFRLQSFEDYANPAYDDMPADLRSARRRDLALFRGVRALLDQADGSVLVWYGAMHITRNFGFLPDGVTRDKTYGMPWFGDQVRADYELAKRSLVLGLVYFDCLSYYDQLFGDTDAPEAWSAPGFFSKQLASVQTGNLSLLALDLPGSPFNDHSLGFKTWSDYADYIVMVRGSGKLEELFKP